MRSTSMNGLALVASMSTTLALAGTTPAFAFDGRDEASRAATHAAEPADRVIQKLDEHVLETSGEDGVALVPGTRTTVAPAEPVPADERPRPGETVRVHYADATVVHRAVTPLCTVSATAGTPVKLTRHVRGITKYTQNGCADIESSTAALEIETEPGWVTKASRTSQARNGITVTNYHTWSCQSTEMSSWRTVVANTLAGHPPTIVEASAAAELGCGGGLTQGEGG